MSTIRAKKFFCLHFLVYILTLGSGSANVSSLYPEPYCIWIRTYHLPVSGSILFTFLYADSYIFNLLVSRSIFFTPLYLDPYFILPVSGSVLFTSMYLDSYFITSLYLDQYFFTSVYPDRTIWALWTRIALKYLPFLHCVKSPNVHKLNMCYKHRSVNYLQWSVRESSFNNFFLVFSRFYL